MAGRSTSTSDGASSPVRGQLTGSSSASPTTSTLGPAPSSPLLHAAVTIPRHIKIAKIRNDLFIAERSLHFTLLTGDELDPRHPALELHLFSVFGLEGGRILDALAVPSTGY